MKKKSTIKSLINEIDNYSKLIRESYVFDEEDQDLGYDDEEDGEIYDDNGEDFESDLSMGNESEDKIDKIRELALAGIQEYAKEVDSDEYNMFKNIWMTCDKFYASKNKEEEDK